MASSRTGMRVALGAAATTVALAAAPASDARLSPGRGVDGTFLVARVQPGATVALRAHPAGRVVARVGRWTDFGSPRVFTIFRRSGRWLGVSTPEFPNHRLAWIDERRGLTFTRTSLVLHASLSRRALTLRQGARVTARIRVGIGGSTSTTPTGRFSVTDKLPGWPFGAYYGCCILAISGNQPNLPPGWTGGTRLGIHGTNRPGTIGRALSAGCLRAADEPLRLLLRRVPLGTPVFVFS